MSDQQDSDQSNSAPMPGTFSPPPRRASNNPVGSRTASAAEPDLTASNLFATVGSPATWAIYKPPVPSLSYAAEIRARRAAREKEQAEAAEKAKAAEEAMAVESSDTNPAVVEARQDRAEAKNKPAPLFDTWGLANAYDPEHFGYPLPGPKQAWGLTMPKDTPDVSRGYRNTVHADGEDDSGPEQLIFRSQDQAPYTAMGLSWAQNEQSQAKFVMSHREWNADEIVRSYRFLQRRAREQKAREAEENPDRAECEGSFLPQSQEGNSEITADLLRTIFRQSGAASAVRDDETGVDADEESLPAQQVPDLEVNVGQAAAEEPQPEKPQPEEPQPEELHPEEVEEDSSSHSDNMSPSDSGSELQTPIRRSTDPAIKVMEYATGRVHNPFSDFIPQNPFSILTSVRHWIMEQYRYVSPILRESMGIFLFGVWFWALLSLVCIIGWLLTRLHMDSPYSVTHDAQLVPSTDPKATTISVPTPARVSNHVQSDQPSIFQGLNIMSSFGGVLISLTSFFGDLSALTISSLEFCFSLVISVSESLIDLLMLLWYSFMSLCGYLAISGRLGTDIKGIASIFATLVVFLGWYFNQEIRKVMRSAQVKGWNLVAALCTRLARAWKILKKVPFKIAARPVLYWTLFVLWSAIMFLAGFGFRDMYDGFEKVTIVATPC